jgi:Lantibiotic dehydratase, N terminus
MDAHLVPLTGDWALWRDFAVRSAGFPLEGLSVFGGEYESHRLAKVAGDPAFAEAVIWQSRSAYRTALAKIAGSDGGSGSRRRQRDGVVAGYWQRYCAKNDTVGFFGPLAWGRIRDDGLALAVRSGALVASRQVHFESWCLEALMAAVGTEAVVPLNRRPEVELREQLEAHGDAAALAALDRVEAARQRVAEASAPDELLAALDSFDSLIEELTGEPPAPAEDGAEGGRTPLYLDCMRDLEVDVGPSLTAELATALPLLLEASRWWCGRSFAQGRAIIADVLSDTADGASLAPVFGRVFNELWELPRLLGAEVAELQERCAAIVAGGDPETTAARAAAAFADHGPAWPLSVFQSADVQVDAPDLEAIERGEFLAVIGDFHSGNPLMQALFSNRYPDFDVFRSMWHADVGEPIFFPALPRNPGTRLTARNIPDASNPDDVHLLGPGMMPVHVGYRSVPVDRLVIRGEEVVDREGEFRAPLTDVVFGPIFLSAMRTFEPFPEAGARITLGRTVLRRATWLAKAADQPAEAAAIPAWAGELGLPRRVFALVGDEAKPVYVDLESPALVRNLHRMMRRAIAADADASVRFSEMLPGADGCWLEGENGRYTCELRIVAVDQTRRGGGTLPTP